MFQSNTAGKCLAYRYLIGVDDIARSMLQKLRARLIPVLRFSTVAADHVVVKENDYPLFIYFVVSGEIEMKKTIYDKVSLLTL